MPKRCRVVRSEVRVHSDRDAGMGMDMADTVGMWNSGRETCILHLPKNPNQFFVLVT